MQTLDFNRIYVIESIGADPDEPFTGTDLYNNVLQHLKTRHAGKDAVLISVDTPDELLKALDSIRVDCMSKGVKPIIHLEIHGLEDFSGLDLNKGSVSWGELYPRLSSINEASGWNLFLTMAVCWGNYAMSLVHPRHPAPFSGIVGSFEELYVWDLEIRYDAFYQELTTSLDLDKALDALHNSNPALPADYRFIDAEQTFKNVYQKYFDTQFSPDMIGKRFRSELKAMGVVFTDRNIKQKYYVDFRARLQRTKTELFEKDRDTFFLFDKFPQNRNKYCVGWKPV